MWGVCACYVRLWSLDWVCCWPVKSWREDDEWFLPDWRPSCRVMTFNERRDELAVCSCLADWQFGGHQLSALFAWRVLWLAASGIYWRVLWTKRWGSSLLLLTGENKNCWPCDAIVMFCLWWSCGMYCQLLAAEWNRPFQMGYLLLHRIQLTWFLLICSQILSCASYPLRLKSLQHWTSASRSTATNKKPPSS